MNEPAYLTVAQLADRWQISQPTIRRWIRQGRLPHTKFVGGVRFDLRDVENYEAQARQPTKAA